MKLFIKYPGFSPTFYYLLIQIEQSIPYALEFCDQHNINSPEQLFRVLKSKLQYKNDKGGIEQLQSMPTLMSENNIHGIPGAGDCDCFTITASACALSQGYKTDIVLVGRNETEPVHIYNLVNGKYFDLTQRNFNSRRIYPYKQIIPLNPIK